MQSTKRCSDIRKLYHRFNEVVWSSQGLNVVVVVVVVCVCVFR